MGKCSRCGAKFGDETVGAGIEVEVTWAAFEDGDYNQQFSAEIPRSKHFCASCLDLLGDAVKGRGSSTFRPARHASKARRLAAGNGARKAR